MYPKLKKGIDRYQSGFTLVELLVGITVGLIVISGLTVAWGYFARQSDYIIKAAQFNQDTRSALQVVSQEIRRAVAGDELSGDRLLDLRRIGGCSTDVATGLITCTSDVADDARANCVLFDSNIVSRFALDGLNVDPDNVSETLAGSSEINTSTEPRPSGFRLADKSLQVWYKPDADPGDSRETCASDENWETILRVGESNVDTLSFEIDARSSECVNTEILLDLSFAEDVVPNVSLPGRCPDANPAGGVWVESLIVTIRMDGTASLGGGGPRPFNYVDTVKLRNLGLINYDLP